MSEDWILLVDDDAHRRSLIALAFARAGERVIEVSSGEDAVRRMERPSDGLRAVIAKAELPGISGHELKLYCEASNPLVDAIVYTPTSLSQLSNPSTIPRVILKGDSEGGDRYRHILHVLGVTVASEPSSR